MLSVLTTVIIAVKWGEAELFKGTVLQDAMFMGMSLFFVVFFVISIRRVKRSLQTNEMTKKYVNERVMDMQLLVFVVFLVLYTI